MNAIRKLMLTAGLFLQLTGSIYGSYNLNNWANAFLAFGGGSDPIGATQAVLNNKGKSGVRAVLKMASQLATSQPGSSQEFMAVAAWLSSTPSNSFKTKYQASDVQAAGQAIMSATMSGPMPTPVSAPVSAPVSGPVSAPVTTGGSSWYNPFGGGTTTTPAAPVITPAQVQAAQAQQQQADAALAAANYQALTTIVNSGATGATLYNAYVNLILTSLQSAINAISDPATQAAVINNVQAQVATMSNAAASANSHNSRALGRMSSKKAAKKNKHSRSHATR